MANPTVKILTAKDGPKSITQSPPRNNPVKNMSRRNTRKGLRRSKRA